MNKLKSAIAIYHSIVALETRLDGLNKSLNEQVCGLSQTEVAEYVKQTTEVKRD